MNAPENEIKNITPANMLQSEVAYYDEYQDFRGMNFFLLMIIVAAMLPWLVGGHQVFGFNIAGWAWVIPLVISGLICLKNIKLISFPVGLWFVWISLIVVYWFFDRDNPNALQSLLQMIAPFVIGSAASTFRSDFYQMDRIINWISRLAIIAWIILIIRVPIIITGALPGYSFMAAEMIGLLLLGACYTSFYACGSHRHLYYYLSMLLITVISLVRGPMTAMLACMPLTLAPLRNKKRIILIALVIACALVIFNTERVQQKMFYSGSGELTDLHLDNPELRSHGRFFMWEILWAGVVEKPWLGNGWNSHRVTLIRSGSALYAPHNDWLKLLYDLGILGISIYALSMLLQTYFLVRIARWSTGSHQMLAYGAATAFIPYTLVMFTDNVVLYVQFFGNLHFALIGIVYGALRSETEIINEKFYY